MSSAQQPAHILSQRQGAHLLARAARAIVARAGGGQNKQNLAESAARAVAPKLAKYAAGKVKQVVGFKMGGRVTRPRKRRAKK